MATDRTPSEPPLPPWGGPVSSSDSSPFTPLHSAAHQGDSALCERLLNDGAAVDPIDTNRASPLHYAALLGHLDVVRLLVERGADVSLRRTYGEDTPLVAAIRNGHLAVVKLLSSLPAQQATLGHPLLMAVRGDDEQVVRALLAAGADVNHVSSHGESPLGLAKKRRRTSLVALLKAAGATIASTAPTRRAVPAETPAPASSDRSAVTLTAAAEPWVTQLDAKIASKRRQAANKLAALGEEAAEDALLAAFAKEIADVRAWETQRDLLRALAQCGGARTAGYLRQLQPSLTGIARAVSMALEEAITAAAQRAGGA